MKHNKHLSFWNRLYLYQKQRFPIVFLLLATLPVILSSAAVVAQNKPSFLKMFLTLVASICYFFHIRVIDDYRDFKHDSLYHENRPVQAGIISLNVLRKIDVVALLIFLLIAISSSIYVLGLGILMLIYTFFAEKEFLMTEKIRKHFFIYNAINLIQMLLLQVFVYCFFFEYFYLSKTIITHFLFIAVGTLMFDFLRKLKTPQEESTGRDTYTWHLGFGKSVIFYLFLIFLNALLFFVLTILMQLKFGVWSIWSLMLIMILLSLSRLHWIKKSNNTEKLLQGGSLFLYGFFNLLIYFLK